MNQDFIGKTIISVNKPYQIWEHGYFVHNLSNVISNRQLTKMVYEYFYDGTSSKKGYSGYFFAKNLLESIDETAIEKWADFSEAYPDYLEDFLLKLVNPYNVGELVDLFNKIPIDTSPVISISEESTVGIHYGKTDDSQLLYFPDEGIGLFTEIAKINLFNTDELRKFSNIFGLPLGVDLSKTTGLKAFDNLKEYNTYLHFGVAPISLIYMELMAYQNIFNSFIAVKTNDAKLAKKINLKKDFVNKVGDVGTIDRNRSDLIESLRQDYEINLKEPDINERLELEVCRKGLAKSLTEKVVLNTKIVDTFDGDFLETNIYSNLFEIAYNQLKKSLINKTELKKCDHCGHYFETQHGTQRFCSPLPFRKRSSCENSFNQAKARKRKEQNTDGN